MDNYILSLEQKIEKKELNQEVLEELLIKLEFFQKERMIHLMITLFYALFTVIFVCHIKDSIMYFIFALFMTCFLR